MPNTILPPRGPIPSVFIRLVFIYLSFCVSNVSVADGFIPWLKKICCWSAACLSARQWLEEVHWILFSDLMTYSHATLAPASSIWCLADHSFTYISPQMQLRMNDRPLSSSLLGVFILTITNWAPGCLIVNYYYEVHWIYSALICLNMIKLNDFT